MRTSYACNECSYKTRLKCNYDKHLNTRKHEMNMMVPNEIIEQSTPACHKCCSCLRKYYSRNGLWRHKKTCTGRTAQTQPKVEETCELVITLLQQNIDLQKQVMELCKEKPIVVHHTTSFNINVFLNEQCKDALNMMEFVSSLQLQLQDLEMTGNLGYVGGITNIFLKGLKSLDVYKRPIHCSDLKRETLYVKDHDTWEREGDDRALIRKAISLISSRNIKQLPLWQKLNPNYFCFETQFHDNYMKMVGECMGASTSEDQLKHENKIIRNIAKVVWIEKPNYSDT